jgi:hypothetical protein
MKVGDKVRITSSDYFSTGEIVQCVELSSYNNRHRFTNPKEGYRYWLHEHEYELVEDQPKDDHYNNDNGSLYLFAQQHGLNAYEFEVIKRIVRCRKKGEFISDIEKTKRVLDLYLKEQGHNYKDQVEQLNK